MVMNDLEYLSQNLEQFKSQYAKFSECVPKLLEALSKAFDVPKVTSEPDYLVLGLTKLCIDRFEDILILCTQGRGEGAMPLVRAMFESLVNGSYIEAHPEKAEDFRRYLFVFIKKVQGQIEKLNSKVVDAAHKKTIDDALKLYAGPDGKIPGPKHDWTELNLVDRAKDVGLGEYVVASYYRPIETTHPSMIHVYSLSKDKDGQRLVFGNAKEFSRQKVKEALAISHFLAIEVLVLLHKTFGNDELKPYIAQSSADYNEAWASVLLPKSQQASAAN
jgi:hypothetical protein